MVIHKDDGSEVADCFYCKHFMSAEGVWHCCQGDECGELEQPVRTCMLFEWRDKDGAEREE